MWINYSKLFTFYHAKKESNTLRKLHPGSGDSKKMAKLEINAVSVQSQFFHYIPGIVCYRILLTSLNSGTKTVLVVVQAFCGPVQDVPSCNTPCNLWSLVSQPGQRCRVARPHLESFLGSRQRAESRGVCCFPDELCFRAISASEWSKLQQIWQRGKGA